MIKLKFYLVVGFGISLFFLTCRVDEDIIDPDTLETWKYYDISTGLTNNNIKCLITDKNNNIWVGTFGGGVCKYSSGNWTSVRKSNGLLDDRVYSFCFDSDGNLWVGNYGGISIIGANGSVIANIPTVNGDAFKARTLFRDSKNNIWIGTDSTFYTYDVADNILYASNYGQGMIYSFAEESNGRIWMACDYGAIYYTYSTGAFNLYTIVYNKYYYGLNTIMVDKDKNMWFGVQNLDKAIKKTSLEKEFINLYNTDVLSIVQDKKQTMWFTTLNGGVTRYDGLEPKSFGLKDGLKNLFIQCSMVDNDGNVWFGTGGSGICIYLQE